MFELKYSKKFSIKNIDKFLDNLKKRSENNNEIRVKVFKTTTVDLPYRIEISKKEINKNIFIIELKIFVKLKKIFFLYFLTGLLVGGILDFTIKSHIIFMPIFINIVIFLIIGLVKVYNSTENMVIDWINQNNL